MGSHPVKVAAIRPQAGIERPKNIKDIEYFYFFLLRMEIRKPLCTHCCENLSCNSHTQNLPLYQRIRY